MAYASLLVPYEAAAMDLEAARSAVATAIGEAAGTRVTEERAPGRARLVEIPTRYGGSDGEDLSLVAELTGMTEAEVVDLYGGTEYEVFMLGFAPGFAYLGLVPEAIALPRRATPRPRVPAGSVAIAGRQTAVYPVETPGGWHLIGRTDLVLWDAARQEPALLAPGDRVRFVRVR